MPGRVAAGPLARRSRGNLTHAVERALKPDRCHFERNACERAMMVLLRRLAALAPLFPFSKN